MLGSAWGRIGITFALASAAFAAAAVSTVRPPEPAPVYVTWEGIGPDKWASIWLLRRHIDPQAEIHFVDPGVMPDDGTAFDIPGSDYMRAGPITTFEALLASDLGSGIDSPDVARMAEIINEMEVSRWHITASSNTGLVERGFRNLQFRFDRDAVPFSCYMSFFDNLETLIDRADGGPVDPSILDTGDRLCEHLPENGKTQSQTVQEMQARTVLETLGKGANIVFVDTRERAEFDEFHIPGAVHMPLREVSAERMAQFADADLVIPYCVKDFRGFEVARAMSSLGVQNVAIMNPYGIRGWRNVGLPVAGDLAMSQPDAMAALSSCASNPDGCLQ
ncbi:chromate resistance protein ChrB domain-containing protein [uncultured Roseobacter sp.]|uniref:chromate resistance protein ChrB domain-containing protein n=1 Tax=uncultured Roseobacter sp. TaxID=114847 RepID=UPI0026345CA0|nr:chromate resistance protein ChrB domain-containing protein [uncultured Roseobacter sp.]